MSGGVIRRPQSAWSQTVLSHQRSLEALLIQEAKQWFMFRGLVRVGSGCGRGPKWVFCGRGRGRRWWPRVQGALGEGLFEASSHYRSLTFEKSTESHLAARKDCLHRLQPADSRQPTATQPLSQAVVNKVRFLSDDFWVEVRWNWPWFEALTGRPDRPMDSFSSWLLRCVSHPPFGSGEEKQNKEFSYRFSEDAKTNFKKFCSNFFGQNLIFFCYIFFYP